MCLLPLPTEQVLPSVTGWLPLYEAFCLFCEKKAAPSLLPGLISGLYLLSFEVTRTLLLFLTLKKKKVDYIEK